MDFCLRDRRFIEVIDASMADAAARAGGQLACRVGCTACCLGPFPITQLDALRLRRALDALEALDPDRAARICGRAREIVDSMRATFPGNAETGILKPDEAAEEGFSSAFEMVPCPVLDPDTGRCELYAARPVSCRTFGPPVQIGDTLLPPCRLCFMDATPAEIDRARVVVDPSDEEDALLRQLEAEGIAGDTIVAFAVAVRR